MQWSRILDQAPFRYVKHLPSCGTLQTVSSQSIKQYQINIYFLKNIIHIICNYFSNKLYERQKCSLNVFDCYRTSDG